MNHRNINSITRAVLCSKNLFSLLTYVQKIKYSRISDKLFQSFFTVQSSDHDPPAIYFPKVQQEYFNHYTLVLLLFSKLLNTAFLVIIFFLVLPLYLLNDTIYEKNLKQFFIGVPFERGVCIRSNIK